MHHSSVIIMIAAAALLVLPQDVEAQNRRRQTLEQGGPLVLRVTPRSFLDPGTVVPVGSIDPGISGYGQTQAYLLSPPYASNRERFGQGVLPDPITNGPFVGSRNPFGPVDFVAPRSLAR
ncbi:hypothetical protein HPT29_000195 [Microvirga terrae]|uniref:Uncharacterized protein n=1 Tax=Microvirga terrae TaxID=2740529 RepID=A0ABY5RRF5_9HYPH|nr:hypothetical protein [Microvirga terrae]UVF19618.1 hypothetical protein HPT29_000195 [Microvirga terrae]